MLFSFGNIQAQSLADTLHEVKVRSRKKKTSDDVRIRDFAPGQKIIIIDSTTMQLYEQQSLANLLTQQVPVFVKSYGVNSIATLNFRGSSAAQSQVLWNGVPLQNAALGLADVSLLPVSLMEKVNVVYGSSSALLGSGNVGGALLLENNAPVFDSNKHRTLQLSLGAGSFGQYQGGLKTTFTSRKWYISAKAFAQTAQNNFSYTNENGVEQHMPNAHLKGGGGLADIGYKLDEKNTFSLTAWYQQYDRQIPPSLFEYISEKDQKDASLRLLAMWQRKTVNSLWYVKSAFLQDRMQYTDPQTLLNTDNLTAQYYGEAGTKQKINAHNDFLVFVPVQIAWMHQDGIIYQQEKAAIAAAWKMHYFRDRLFIALNGRQEWVSGNSFLLPGSNASFEVVNWLKFKVNVQRTYRVPTLNELYYDPGGNKDLKPEQGWNEDAGYAIDLQPGKNISLQHELSFFNRDIHDWIIWFGGSIWTPHNIASVHSRGIESQHSFVWQLHRWQLHAGLNISYTVATTVSSYIINDGSVGKQIPYTPRGQVQVNIGFGYRSFYFNYNHTYTGYRYVTTDESQSLDPFQTGNVQLMYSFNAGKYPVRASFQLNNIWNEQYQVVATRPMPGTNWLAGLYWMFL
ncbi:TonB-dependent receptor [Chitinophagaceae bacterium MMS25-I14]